MAFPLGLGLLAGSAIAKLIGKKKANDQAKKDFAAKDKAARAAHAVSEGNRRGAVDYLNATAGAKGVKNWVPATFQERPYVGPEYVGPSMASDVFDTLGDVAGAGASYVVGQKELEQQEKERMQILCAVYPQAPGCPGAQNAPAPAPMLPEVPGAEG